MPNGTARFLRPRDGQEARVTYVELFFDLIYAFAVTQLSHRLVHDLNAFGALQTLILWFAVWLGWQYTCWVTNWFDPERIPVRLLLFAVMLVGMVMAASLPLAWGERGLVFAISYVTIQVGRSIVVLRFLGGQHALTANFRRICGWLVISGIAWIAGGFLEGPERLACWAFAVLCEYLSPMFGFPLPGLGRSGAADWRSAEGGHIAERCQAFVILALGESVLVTGGTLSDIEAWSAPTVIAFLVCFLGSVAMWWVYFDTSSSAGSRAIRRSGEPGLMAAYFHYVHVILIAGVIVCAAADDLVILHPDEHIASATAWLLTGGPALFIVGNGLYKRVVYGGFPLSHWIGLVLLAIVSPFALHTDLLMTGGLTTIVMIVVAVWESVSRRSLARAEAAGTQ
ncbi:low temperature requirement protein A [Paraburkholderia sartisoli]|uniref:Low temperature requirement protein LtrA n=1 Tax=Paraburkholderia sartisoli TaxID=83784 RepID=A0A1H4EFW0_9BURK|nr:low temperature requirement protein A [Paraburkholderia sartisoli]SEA83709.1 Low temperature requirement protein LtrA [Paraburkholderia sartisoli]